ncbi:MAG: hypothetical protein LBR73_10050 [Oscillospiraceae bacterium]|jgi:hypothetical protein|nr:hypothetical protein [Oscillospiraceae bacterium]
MPHYVYYESNLQGTIEKQTPPGAEVFPEEEAKAVAALIRDGSQLRRAGYCVAVRTPKTHMDDICYLRAGSRSQSQQTSATVSRCIHADLSDFSLSECAEKHLDRFLQFKTADEVTIDQNRNFAQPDAVSPIQPYPLSEKQLSAILGAVLNRIQTAAEPLHIAVNPVGFDETVLQILKAVYLNLPAGYRAKAGYVTLPTAGQIIPAGICLCFISENTAAQFRGKYVLKLTSPGDADAIIGSTQKKDFIRNYCSLSEEERKVLYIPLLEERVEQPASEAWFDIRSAAYQEAFALEYSWHTITDEARDKLVLAAADRFVQNEKSVNPADIAKYNAHMTADRFRTLQAEAEGQGFRELVASLLQYRNLVKMLPDLLPDVEAYHAYGLPKNSIYNKAAYDDYMGLQEKITLLFGPDSYQNGSAAWNSVYTAYKAEQKQAKQKSIDEADFTLPQFAQTVNALSQAVAACEPENQASLQTYLQQKANAEFRNLCNTDEEVGFQDNQWIAVAYQQSAPLIQSACQETYRKYQEHQKAYDETAAYFAAVAQGKSGRLPAGITLLTYLDAFDSYRKNLTDRTALSNLNNAYINDVSKLSQWPLDLKDLIHHVCLPKSAAAPYEQMNPPAASETVRGSGVAQQKENPNRTATNPRMAALKKGKQKPQTPPQPNSPIPATPKTKEDPSFTEQIYTLNTYLLGLKDKGIEPTLQPPMNGRPLTIDVLLGFCKDLLTTKACGKDAPAHRAIGTYLRIHCPAVLPEAVYKIYFPEETTKKGGKKVRQLLKENFPIIAAVAAVILFFGGVFAGRLLLQNPAAVSAGATEVTSAEESITEPPSDITDFTEPPTEESTTESITESTTESATESTTDTTAGTGTSELSSNGPDRKPDDQTPTSQVQVSASFTKTEVQLSISEFPNGYNFIVGCLKDKTFVVTPAEITGLMYGSTDPSVAEIHPVSGIVHLLKPGSTDIVVQYNGEDLATVKLVVK